MATVENKESKYDKAYSALSKLLEQRLSNLDNGTNNRLNQTNIQSAKKYYYEEYRHFPEYKYLLFLFLGSFFAYMFFRTYRDNILGGINVYEIFGVAGVIGIYMRYEYDRGISTYIYIQKILGPFNSEKHDTTDILTYLEKNIFFQNFSIKQNSYYLLAILLIGALVIGYFAHKPIFLVVLPIVTGICLIEPFFVSITKVTRKNREKKEREKREKRQKR